MTNCPDCDSVLVVGRCQRCGWKHENTPKVHSTREWVLPHFTPPTAEEQKEIRALIAETAAKLQIAAEDEPTKKPLAHLPKRCPACDAGNFVHMHIRYCLACYLALGRAS